MKKIYFFILLISILFFTLNKSLIYILPPTLHELEGRHKSSHNAYSFILELNQDGSCIISTFVNQKFLNKEIYSEWKIIKINSRAMPTYELSCIKDGAGINFLLDRSILTLKLRILNTGNFSKPIDPDLKIYFNE